MEYAMSNSSKMSVATMYDPEVVLAAYHRAVAREFAKSGVQWPLVRASCVNEEGTVGDTQMMGQNVVAFWSLDALGRVRVKLV